MLPEFHSEIEQLFRLAGVQGPVIFSVPPKPEMGDLAFGCFPLAKQQSKSPVEVAGEISQKINSLIKPGSILERVLAFGPYVNLFLNAEIIAGQTIKNILVPKPLKIKTAQKKVLIEYPSNNTHKEFHIGHFRNVCIGNTLVKLYETTGVKVYPVNYLNDFGSHVAKCLWGLSKFHSGEKPPKNKQKWLGEIYAEASRYLKDHPDAESEVATVQKQLEANDKKIWPVFLKTRKWSIDKFAELFKELGVKHVAVFYEKDIKSIGQKKVDELLKKGIAKIGEGGAVIIDLSEYKLDIALLRKSNGTGLYLTSDLPLAEKKFDKFNVDESIVITGEEQKFYFKQLYKILELSGIQKKLTHLSYGLVNLPEGKMSSRTGNVILYENLRDQVYEKMSTETKQRHTDWSNKKIIDVAGALTQAALKFDMQKHEASKNIVFDINEATSFEGFSGPYILYSVARINSLEAKAKKEKIQLGNLYSGLVSFEEKQLIMLMGESGEVYKNALENYNPSAVARYSFELAKAFNNFYNKHKIVGAESKALSSARLALSLAVRKMLERSLGILTIKTIKEM